MNKRTIIKKILILLGLVFIVGCSGAVFEKGLNYEETPDYIFEYNKDTYTTTIRKSEQRERYINVGFGKVSCGYYGLIGPLIFPIIPFWENRKCEEAVISIWEYRIGIKNVHVLYHDKTYEPSEISDDGRYYTFPLQTKSITETAILVVEKKDGEIFKIPFRYKHTFSFNLAPGR